MIALRIRYEQVDGPLPRDAASYEFIWWHREPLHLLPAFATQPDPHGLFRDTLDYLVSITRHQGQGSVPPVCGDAVSRFACEAEFLQPVPIPPPSLCVGYWGLRLQDARVAYTNHARGLA